MRKLVSVQKVKDIVPIVGADRVEVCVINGWQCVVRKGEYQVGSLVLYVEIDAFLNAEDPRFKSFEDRFTNWGNKRGLRVKTIKLRSTLSQGLVLSPLDFPEVTNAMLVEGMDVTDILKIEKWEPVEKFDNSGSRTVGSSTGKKFPAFIRKTDQERIQNYGALVERALDEEFEVTVKKDGSSLTVFRVDPSSPYYKDAKALTEKKKSLWDRVKTKALDIIYNRKPEAVYGICSRNLLLKLDGDTNFHEAVRKYDLLGKLSAMRGSFALQGELVAPDIQNNYEKVKEIEFHLFDIYNIDKQEYVLPLERKLISLHFGIPHASIIERGRLRNILNLQEGNDVVKKCLEYAEGPGDNAGVKREGVVMKAVKRDFSFKAVSNSYLLATGK